MTRIWFAYGWGMEDENKDKYEEVFRGDIFYTGIYLLL
jgi:hypothetical protein